ncbi:hypothetical protein [Pectobacterium brasiliense]|uniref:hypothetical protein n=1 Tax=Pectobacterium brasiliense TaxID=180957 RepID=UPI001F08354E|nr:hypothetical protein [Pectobacterium brasiliense]
MQQVFMPFFTTRANGIGLEMALTDTLIQRLNGTIEVSNSTGRVPSSKSGYRYLLRSDDAAVYSFD